MDTKSKFEVTDYYHLLALHRAVMLMKFDSDPIDMNLVFSPYIAEMSKNILKTLIDMELEMGKKDVLKNWNGFKAANTTPSAERWSIVVKNACTITSWTTIDMEKKKELVQVLFSPFELDDALLNQLIEEVDEKVVSEA